jgi:hypothetical protein
VDVIAEWLVAAGACVVALLLLSMLLYERLMVALAWLLHALFALGLVAAGSSLLSARPYDWAAARLVEQSGVPAQVREVDVWLQALRELPDTVWERVRHPFGTSEQPPAIAPLALPPLPGPLEARIVPTLCDTLAALLRIVAFLAGMILMLIGLYYRSVTDLILQLRTLRRRVDELEARVSVAEKARIEETL